MTRTRAGTNSSALLILCAAILIPALLCGPAATQESDLEAQARQALSKLFDALTSGDPERVRPFLAPEFQILRSNGAAYDKEQYLARGIPRIESKPVFNDLVITRNGDIVVTRMRMRIEEILDGKKAESNAPNLIVFRVTPDGWQVVASGNFAKLAN